MTEAVQPKKKSSAATGYVLIVDDDPGILATLGRILRLKGHEVLTAESGPAAVELMHHEPVALLICDYSMPEMDGIEVLKEAASLQPEARRIILAGYSDKETVLEALNVGQAWRFVEKPWDPEDLLKTVDEGLVHFHLLQENRRLQAEVDKAYERLRIEVEVGARVQETMLFGKAPKVEGLEITAMSKPSTQVGGDFYDFYQPAPHVLDLLISDVMGKGVPAALVGTALKTQLTRFAIPYERAVVMTEQQDWKVDLLSPMRVVQRAEQETAPSLLAMGYFATLFYGRFNFHNLTFSYVDCGSTKPILYRAERDEVITLEAENMPIGTSPEQKLEQIDIPFHENDLFLFYSDAVTEARNNGEFFGEERLVTLLREHADRSGEEITQAIREALFGFTGEASLADDLTLIVVKVQEAKTTLVGKASEEYLNSDLAQLVDLRTFITRFCSEAPGNSQLLISQLQLAATEAMSNIVIHGYGKEPRHKVHVSGELKEKGVLLELCDQTDGFDPLAVRPPDLSGGRDHGLGVYIIGELADKVSYVAKESPGGWNRLRIYKKYCKLGGEMEIGSEKRGSVVVIELKGENLDAAVVQTFKKETLAAIDESGCAKVVFDCSQLKFIDSSGLGAFLSILRELNTREGDLKLAAMQDSIVAMLQVVRMNKLFESHPTVDEAVESYAVQA